MNNKKLFLLSIFTLITATIRPDAVETTPVSVQSEICIETAQATTHPLDLCKMYRATVVPAVAIGASTGMFIGYVSGKFFDAIMNEKVMNAILYNCGPKAKTQIKAFVSLARLGAQVGSRYYWSGPLRNKLMNWLLDDLKNHSVACNEEMAKTIARVAERFGLATQVRL